MKVFQIPEMCCGDCGYVLYQIRPREVDEAGQRRLKCTNRGCVNHGKVFLLTLAPLEAEEVSE